MLLVSGDFVETGGMDRANHALARHLLDRGVETHLVAYRVDPALLGRPNLRVHLVAKPLGSYLLGHPVLSRAGTRAAAAVARQGGRVVVNGGNCRWGDVNWLHHLNVLDRPRTAGGPLRQLHRRASYHLFVREDRAALRRARQIITTCERNKADLVAWLAIEPATVTVIPYGSDPATFHPVTPAARAALRDRLGWPQDRPVFVFVGALGDRRKGFDTLFRAWGLLCARSDWDGQLVVVGTGAERPAWEQRTAAAGLAARITFLGFRRDVPAILQAGDAHVLPSRYEGYSLATQEALGCGLPAFVSRTAGVAERYPPILAELLIPDPDDAEDLAERLRRWRSQPARIAGAVAALGEELRAQTWDQMAARLAAVTGLA